jgi:hypothetical protein
LISAVYRHNFSHFVEFSGEYVAQFKFTVLLMPNGPDKITGLPFDPSTCETDKTITDLDIQVHFVGISTSFNIKFIDQIQFFVEKKVKRYSFMVNHAPEFICGYCG